MTNGAEHCHKNGFHTNGVENGLSEVDGEVHVCLLSLSCIILLIIYMTKLLQSDWLRGVQLFH